MRKRERETAFKVKQVLSVSPGKLRLPKRLWCVRESIRRAYLPHYCDLYVTDGDRAECSFWEEGYSLKQFQKGHSLIG